MTQFSHLSNRNKVFLFQNCENQIGNTWMCLALSLAFGASHTNVLRAQNSPVHSGSWVRTQVFVRNEYTDYFLLSWSVLWREIQQEGEALDAVVVGMREKSGQCEALLNSVHIWPGAITCGILSNYSVLQLQFSFLEANEYTHWFFF